MNNISPYIIITPAFNEDRYIEQTIHSVLNQNVLPEQWIIVDDGSNDGSAQIIKHYTEKHNFIEYYYRKKPEGQEYFASNVFAIMMGYEKIKSSSYRFLAILDADIRLPTNYYQRIFEKFKQDSQLGVASGVYENLIDGKLCKVLHDRRSTPKAIQVFRKEVFEKINGFLPLKFGGEDTISCVMARMTGWQARSFPDIKVVHLRPTGTGTTKNILQVRFKQGICEHSLAAHPVFFLLKVLRRSFCEKPYFIGGVARLVGYIWAAAKGNEINLPKEVVKYIRQEQLSRILNANRIERHKIEKSP